MMVLLATCTCALRPLLLYRASQVLRSTASHDRVKALSSSLYVTTAFVSADNAAASSACAWVAATVRALGPKGVAKGSLSLWCAAACNDARRRWFNPATAASTSTLNPDPSTMRLRLAFLPLPPPSGRLSQGLQQYRTCMQPVVYAYAHVRTITMSDGVCVCVCVCVCGGGGSINAQCAAFM